MTRSQEWLVALLIDEAGHFHATLVNDPTIGKHMHELRRDVLEQP